MGAAPTTPGRAGTARRPGPGKQDGKAYECRNQWWNPLKSFNRLEPGGSGPGQQCAASRQYRRGDSVAALCRRREATGKACGVPVARLQGKSWAPTPSTGHGERGNRPLAAILPAIQVGSGQARRQPMARGRGGASVVVRGRESRPHGEGTQRVCSRRTGRPGGRR